MSKEAGTWKWLRDRLPKGHHSRIESEVGDGFPDVHYTMFPGESVTFELKYADGPKATPLKGKIRLSQKRWHLDEAQAGGRSWIVAEFPHSGHVILFIEGHCIPFLEGASYEWLEKAATLRLPRRAHVDTCRARIRELIEAASRKSQRSEDKIKR